MTFLFFRSRSPAAKSSGIDGLSELAASQFLSARSIALIVLLVFLFGWMPARAENEQISIRRALERTNFTNEEIVDGFLKIAFGAELQFGQRVERIRKFDGPVRIFIDSRGTPNRRAQMETIVADIRNRVHHLDLTIVHDRQAANLVVTLVPKRDFQRTIRMMYGDRRAKQIEQLLKPQCLSGLSKDGNYRIQRAQVILPVDITDFRFYDCAYEEMLQALGAINDDRSVPWTMFNDDVQMGFFDVYDQYLLNLIYDPRIRPGMTKEEAGSLLPIILPTLRARLSQAN